MTEIDHKHPDLMKVRAVAREIPGWLGGEEVHCLYRLGRESTGNILEIGTYCAKSTFVIASGILDAEKEHMVITIDAHLDRNTEQPLCPDSILSVQTIIRDQDLDDTIIQMIGWSEDCIKFIDFSKIKAVFIDGGHDYDTCSEDFHLVRERTRDHPITRFLFHDYKKEFPGVCQLINDVVKKDPDHTFVKVSGSIYMCDFRK